MSPQYPELSQSQIEQIFSKKIQAHIDTLTVGSKAATLVMVGAQPAAGKTKAVDRELRSTPGMYYVNGDALRRYHPNYDRLKREAPELMPQATSKAMMDQIQLEKDFLKVNPFSKSEIKQERERLNKLMRTLEEETPYYSLARQMRDAE